MVTADQLICHAIGDYVIQSDWMAGEKTRRFSVALLHATSYALPFLFLTHSVYALAAIVSTHAVIDRWRLARFVVFMRNGLAPGMSGKRWIDFDPNTGFARDRPAWLTTWLLIICDNVMHVLINAAAIRVLS